MYLEVEVDGRFSAFLFVYTFRAPVCVSTNGQSITPQNYLYKGLNYIKIILWL
jgi:hypothetical protein